jgi:pimeloyl-ACP methyl ester carboxylesterase
VHGLGHWTSGAWDRLVPQLDPAWRILAFDLPGFGESARPPVRYDLALFARVAAELAERTQPARLWVCGHSLGGLVAAELAARLPEQVERLALIAPAGMSASPRQAALVLAGPVLAAAGKLAFPAPLVDLVWRHAVRDPASLDPVVLAAARGYARERAWRRAFTGVYAAARPLVRGLRAQQQRFARYRGPVLVVWGRGDRFLPVAAAARVPAIYPQAEIAILDGSAHLPMVEEPRAVGALLRAFLR